MTVGRAAGSRRTQRPLELRAIEYALRNQADYSALLFVRAVDRSTLDANLAALASAAVLDLPEKKEECEDAVRREAALRWLEAHPTWFMILDNVDSPEAVASVTELLARLKGGRILITARAANFPASVRKLEIGVLDEKSAVQFLMERTRDDRTPAGDDEHEARAIANEVGCLALGLEQAGAFIATERIGFADYLKLWRDRRKTVVDWFDPTLMGYSHDTGLAATWATSVDRLKPASRRLLDRLAMLAPDPFPDSLIDVAVPGEAKDYDARPARGDLYAYCLLTRAMGRDGSAGGFVMHRLVQDFARRAMPEDRKTAALREALGWMDEAFVVDPVDVRSWQVLDALAPHVLAVAHRADEAGIVEPTDRLLNEVACLAMARARFADAEPLYCRLLAIGEATLAPDDPNLADPLNNLGRLLHVTGRFDEAEPLLRRSLAIAEAAHGPDDPRTAAGLNSLAGLLKDRNRLNEAEPPFWRALGINERSFGPEDSRVATDLNNLASLMRAEHPDEAEPLFRRALAIDEAKLGPDHLAVATKLNNLAGLLEATKRLDEAEPLYLRALKIDETELGPDHPDVARDLSNLAGLLLLRWTKRVAEAERMMRRALAIDERTFGRDHPNVAVRLNNLAWRFTTWCFPTRGSRTPPAFKRLDRLLAA